MLIYWCTRIKSTWNGWLLLVFYCFHSWVLSLILLAVMNKTDEIMILFFWIYSFNLSIWCLSLWSFRLVRLILKITLFLTWFSWWNCLPRIFTLRWWFWWWFCSADRFIPSIDWFALPFNNLKSKFLRLSPIYCCTLYIKLGQKLESQSPSPEMNIFRLESPGLEFFEPRTHELRICSILLYTIFIGFLLYIFQATQNDLLKSCDLCTMK